VRKGWSPCQNFSCADDDDRDHDDVTHDDDDVLCDNKKVSLCVCVCTVEMQLESALEIQEERARGPLRQNTRTHGRA